MSEFIKTINIADKCTRWYKEGNLDPQGLELELLALGFYDIKIAEKTVEAKFIGHVLFLGDV